MTIIPCGDVNIGHVRHLMLHTRATPLGGGPYRTSRLTHLHTIQSNSHYVRYCVYAAYGRTTSDARTANALLEWFCVRRVFALSASMGAQIVGRAYFFGHILANPTLVGLSCRAQ